MKKHWQLLNKSENNNIKDIEEEELESYVIIECVTINDINITEEINNAQLPSHTRNRRH